MPVVAVNTVLALVFVVVVVSVAWEDRELVVGDPDFWRVCCADGAVAAAVEIFSPVADCRDIVGTTNPVVCEDVVAL